MTIETVGIVGLGKMGGPLARHLAGGGFRAPWRPSPMRG